MTPVVATYGGGCTKCNLDLSFEVSREIPGVNE
jgi:hypothetical protein